MSNISESLLKTITEARKNLRYAKVLNESDDKSWSIRQPGENLFPFWKQHLFKMLFHNEDAKDEDKYYETTQQIVCYDAISGGEDSVTCTYENGCFFCIGAKLDVPIQEIYDIEHIWQWIEDDDKLAVKKSVLQYWKNGCNIWGVQRLGLDKCCYGCIRPKICVLMRDDKPVTDTVDTYNGEVTKEIGWCEKCSRCKRCQEEGRKSPNKVTRRIYWTVGCSNFAVGEITLCDDVCDDHFSVEKDCPCSQTAKDLRSNKYIYL